MPMSFWCLHMQELRKSFHQTHCNSKVKFCLWFSCEIRSLLFLYSINIILFIFLTLLRIFLFLIFFFLKKHFQKCMSKCLRALESCTTPEIIDVQTSYPLHCKKMTNDFFTYLSRYTNDMMRICKDIILYLTYFAVVIIVSILLVCVCVKLRAGQVFYFSVTNTTLYLQIFWYRGWKIITDFNTS